MNINENKTKEQNLVLEKWANNNYKGTYYGYTGVGKTRIGTIAAAEFIKRNPSETSLIVVPTENLRDNEWTNSFIKWGYGSQIESVTIECIQTAYKRTGSHFNTLVVDEVHSTLGSNYKALFENNTFDRILCLTATLDNEEHKSFLESLAPVIWITDKKRALELNLVSPCIIYNLAVPLTEDELINYKVADNGYRYYENALGGSRKAFSESSYILKLSKNMNNLVYYNPENRIIDKQLINNVTIKQTDCRLLNDSEIKLLKDKTKNAANYWRYMRERRSICQNSYNKILACKQLVDKFSDRKTIIFSDTTEIANQIKDLIGDKCLRFHSKLTETEKRESLLSFSNGDKPIISAVKALDEGMDVPDCSLGISNSGDSTKRRNLQRNGRISRYVDGKVAIFVNLYNADTQDFKWVFKRTQEQSPKWINSIDEIII